MSVMVIAIWFSFLLGTIYANYWGEEQSPRANRQTNGETGCILSCSGLKGDSEKELKNELDKESEGINELVIADRKPVLSESTQNDKTSGNQDVIPIQDDPTESEREDYHLTWTTVEGTQTTILSAYYDDRPAMHGPSIVLPGYQSKKFRNQTLFCLFRNKDGTTECSPHKSIFMEMDACNGQKEFDKKKERQFLHVFHICRLAPSNDKSTEIPSHVALSASNDCQPSSSFIPVYNHRPEKKIEYGVCIQTPAFGKTSQEFVSFIELYQMLGAKLFTLYVLNIDQVTLSFLQKTYGGKNGILDIVQWSDRLHEKEPIHYYGEIIAINDCMYRNMHTVKYLALVDLDEAIVPRRYPNWSTMMKEIDQPYIDSFIFVNSIFMATEQEEIDQNMLSQMNDNLCGSLQLPVYLKSFNRVTCEFNYFSRSKIIVKPELIIDIDIHSVCSRIGNTTNYLVPSDSALSQHYRVVPTMECRKNRKTRKYPSKLDFWMTRYTNSLLTSLRQHFCE